jgi:HNH endonuclease/Homeodomain-like domain
VSGFIDRAGYDVALSLLADGKYRVDQRRGVVIGPSGAVIGTNRPALPRYGYVYCALYDHHGSRHQLAAHRVIWESAHGPIPDGLEVNHINGDKADNRIQNLEVVAPSENQRHAHRLGLKRGVRGAANVLAKLEPDVVREIRDRYASGHRQCDIADTLGVSRPQVSRIVRRLTWDV